MHIPYISPSAIHKNPIQGLRLYKTMLPCPDSSTEVPAPSDFRDLVDCILQLNLASTDAFHELASLQHRPKELAPGSPERREIATRIVSVASGLESQYQELDAHYGWVLASDHALVNEVLRSYFGRNEKAERWLRRMNVEMANCRSSLREIIQRFGD
jgi:hypothetical protein